MSRHDTLCPCTVDSKSLCLCDTIRAAYRRGYNAHAASAAHWEATHGAYQQHGRGENP